MELSSSVNVNLFDLTMGTFTYTKERYEDDDGKLKKKKTQRICIDFGITQMFIEKLLLHFHGYIDLFVKVQFSKARQRRI